MTMILNTYTSGLLSQILSHFATPVLLSNFCPDVNHGTYSCTHIVRYVYNRIIIHSILCDYTH